MTIKTNDYYFMNRDDTEQESLCPTGYAFITNMSYGTNQVYDKYIIRRSKQSCTSNHS